MQAVLPLLIERAQEERDHHALALRRCAQAVQQAQATLAQLERFREDYLRRSPVLAGQPVQAHRLADWQVFIGRLDDALALQRQDIVLREQQQAQAQAALGAAQRRLLSFETLARRVAQQRQLRQERRAQIDTDEFAARAVRAQLLGEHP